MYPILDTTPTGIADWAEWYVAYSQQSLSKPALVNDVALIMGSTTSDDMIDSLIDSVWLILRTRQKLYGPGSPIKVAARLLTSRGKWQDHPHYLACLIFALTGNIEQVGAAGQLFEEVSTLAVKRYLGGEGVTCGFPTTLHASDLASLVTEPFIKEYPSYRKDRNLDILAWIPFNDGRPNQIIVMVQCASGRNWRSKTKELNLEAWKKYIHFLSPPIRSFTLPDIITDDRFEEQSTDAGLILDRSRIYRCIYGVTLSTDLKARLIKWCKARISTMNKMTRNPAKTTSTRAAA